MLKDKSASVGKTNKKKKRFMICISFVSHDKNVEMNKFLFTVNSFVCETLSEEMNDNIRSVCAH